MNCQMKHYHAIAVVYGSERIPIDACGIEVLQIVGTNICIIVRQIHLAYRFVFIFIIRRMYIQIDRQDGVAISSIHKRVDYRSITTILQARIRIDIRQFVIASVNPNRTRSVRIYTKV